MEEELISVIVPVYNVEKYLPMCLESISNQTYRNLEIILVDDGSTDSSGQICDDYAVRDSRARVIHQENRKLWATRNRGLSEAHGAYVFFPDADDYFHRDLIRVLYTAINLGGKPYPMAACGEKKTSSLEEDVSSNIVPRCVFYSQEQIFDIFFSGVNHSLSLMVTWNKLYRTAFLPVPFQQNYLRGQDLDSNLRFYLRVKEIVLVDNIMYYWVQHPGQLTRAKDNMDIAYECHIKMFFKILKELKENERRFAHYFIDKMYKRMAIYKARMRWGEKRRSAFTLCRQVERQTIVDLVKCRDISFVKKIGLLVFLHGGLFTWLFLKATKNL